MPRDAIRAPWLDVLALWVAAVGLLWIGLRTPPFPGWVQEAWSVLPSAWLVLSPWLIARIRGRDPQAWLLGEGNPLASLGIGVLVGLIVFPIYAGLFHGWSILVERRPMHWEVSRLADFPIEIQGRPQDLGGEGPALWVFGQSGWITLWNRTSQDVEVRLEGCQGTPEGLRVQQGRWIRGRAAESAAGWRLAPGMGLRCPVAVGPATLVVPVGTPMRLGEEGRPVVAEAPMEVGRSFAWIGPLLWTHLLAVAFPEEVFYRGFVQPRLAERFRRRIRVLGAAVGPEVILASGLFALSHLVLVPAPFRLAVFFPGLLFGWIRERTGSVAGAILVHGLSNVLLALLTRLQGP